MACLLSWRIKLKSSSRRVMGEDEVAIGTLDGPVAVEAALEHRPVGQGSAIIEWGVGPAAGCGVLLGVFDHELHAVLGAPGDEGLAAAEGLVVLLRGVEAPGESGDDRAIREVAGAFAVGFDRDVVAQD